MDANRTFYIKGDFIAEQHVATQNIYLSSESPVAEKMQELKRQKQEVVDIDYEPLDAYCEYIDKQALLQAGVYTPLEFEAMLRSACEQDAPTLANFLRKYQQLHYLDFHGHSKKKIFATLSAHFPTMRKYSYANFATYISVVYFLLI